MSILLQWALGGVRSPPSFSLPTRLLSFLILFVVCPVQFPIGLAWPGHSLGLAGLSVLGPGGRSRLSHHPTRRPTVDNRFPLASMKFHGHGAYLRGVDHGARGERPVGSTVEDTSCHIVPTVAGPVGPRPCHTRVAHILDIPDYAPAVQADTLPDDQEDIQCEPEKHPGRFEY